VRPTSDRARKALFDILGQTVSGARVLDLYAGSGAVAIEALSRGAAGATAVDCDRTALERNRDAVAARLEVVGSTAHTAIRRLARAGRRFDIVFADPPYGEVAATGPAESAGVVAPRGLLIWQTDVETALGAPSGFREQRRAAYGRNVFHFFAATE